MRPGRGSNGYEEKDRKRRMMDSGERRALQAALRGTREGLSILDDQDLNDRPAAGILSLIEGELLDLLGLAGPRFRRKDDAWRPPHRPPSRHLDDPRSAGW